VVGRLYHSVEDRKEAVKQLGFDWTALFQDLAVQAGELTPDPREPSGYHYTSQVEFDALRPDPKKVTWWKSYAKPRFAAWAKFRSDQLGQDSTVAPDYQAWAERWSTNWDLYEEWLAKLEALKTAAKQTGFSIGVPPAQRLPETVWAEAQRGVERGAKAVEGAVSDAWTLAKYGVWGALGIGAVVALSSVAHDLRSGKDPSERYTELVALRRSRALPSLVPAPPPRALALPAPARLALPPGKLGLEEI
jgi:hypothetical protein